MGRAIRFALALGLLLLTACSGGNTPETFGYPTRHLRAIAMRMAANNGDAHPSSIRVVRSQFLRANRVVTGDDVNEPDRGAWVLEIRGHFECRVVRSHQVPRLRRATVVYSIFNVDGSKGSASLAREPDLRTSQARSRGEYHVVRGHLGKLCVWRRFVLMGRTCRGVARRTSGRPRAAACRHMRRQLRPACSHSQPPRRHAFPRCTRGASLNSERVDGTSCCSTRRTAGDVQLLRSVEHQRSTDDTHGTPQPFLIRQCLGAAGLRRYDLR